MDTRANIPSFLKPNYLVSLILLSLHLQQREIYLLAFSIRSLDLDQQSASTQDFQRSEFYIDCTSMVARP